MNSSGLWPVNKSVILSELSQRKPHDQTGLQLIGTNPSISWRPFAAAASAILG